MPKQGSYPKVQMQVLRIIGSKDVPLIDFDLTRRGELLAGMRAIKDPERMGLFIDEKARSRPDFVDTPQGLIAATRLTKREIRELLGAPEFPYGNYLQWLEYFKTDGQVREEREVASLPIRARR